ncbi:hypothetical protein ScPMuIL_012279 [Solemya velum]
MAFTTCVWTRLLYSAILLVIVDSRNDKKEEVKHLLGSPKTSTPAMGPDSECMKIDLICNDGRVLLISEITFYLSNEQSTCEVIKCKTGDWKCCKQQDYHTYDGNYAKKKQKLHYYQECSGEKKCVVEWLDIAWVNTRVKVVYFEYYCINDRIITNFHTTEKYSTGRPFVHLMYNITEEYQNKMYSCDVHADNENSFVELYSVDIRLQHRYTNSCSDTTLTYGYDNKENEVICDNYSDYPNMTKLSTWETNTRNILVKLTVRKEQPAMVWIFAKASIGRVSVTCTTTDHHTYRSTEGTTHPLPSVSTSNMLSSINNGYTTELPNVTSPYGSESKLGDDDETNTGAIVGGIVGAIVILASVIIGIFLWRRHQSKVTAGTKTYDNPKDVGKDNTGYEFAKPIAMPTSNGESKFSANHLSGSTDSGESGNSAYSFIKPENLAYQSAGRTGTPYCPDTVTNDSHYNYIDSNKIIVLSNSDSEGTYNHLHEPPKTVSAPSSNAYSHLKFNQGIPSSGDTDYDHIVHNKLDSPNQKASEFDDYDHIEPNRGDMNNQKNNNHSTTTDYEYDHLGSDNVNVQKMPSSNDYDHFSPVKCHEKRIDDDVEADVDANNASTGFTAPHQLPATKQHSTVTVFDNEVPSRRPPKCQDYELAGPLNI